MDAWRVATGRQELLFPAVGSVLRIPRPRASRRPSARLLALQVAAIVARIERTLGPVEVIAIRPSPRIEKPAP